MNSSNSIKWLKQNCKKCKAEIFLHVEWEKPLLLCNKCKAKWIRHYCKKCKVEIYFPVDLVKPLSFCNSCWELEEIRQQKLSSNRAARRTARCAARILGSSKMPKSGHAVSGGLPGVGRKR